MKVIRQAIPIQIVTEPKTRRKTGSSCGRRPDLDFSYLLHTLGEQQISDRPGNHHDGDEKISFGVKSTVHAVVSGDVCRGPNLWYTKL